MHATLSSLRGDVIVKETPCKKTKERHTVPRAFPALPVFGPSSVIVRCNADANGNETKPRQQQRPHATHATRNNSPDH